MFHENTVALQLISLVQYVARVTVARILVKVIVVEYRAYLLLDWMMS
jgi:hypothetical protein